MGVERGGVERERFAAPDRIDDAIDEPEKPRCAEDAMTLFAMIIVVAIVGIVLWKSIADPYYGLLVLVAVNPGWSGQEFIASTQRRAESLIDMFNRAKKDVLLGIDGGITRANLADVVQMGPDIIVTGSAVFKEGRPLETARSMISVLKRAATGLDVNHGGIRYVE